MNPNSQVDQVDNKEYEYIRVEVTREQSTEIYMKVPKDWRPIGRNIHAVSRAAKETTLDGDWDDFGWEQTVGVLSCGVVDEKEAMHYPVYEVKS